MSRSMSGRSMSGSMSGSSMSISGSSMSSSSSRSMSSSMGGRSTSCTTPFWQSLKLTIFFFKHAETQQTMLHNFVFAVVANHHFLKARGRISDHCFQAFFGKSKTTLFRQHNLLFIVKCEI